MDIKKLADKSTEKLTVDEMKSVLQDIGKLSFDELDTLVEYAETNTSGSSSTSQTVLTNQCTAFIKDITSFFDTIIQRYGYDSAQSEQVLEQYEEEFADFAQALATFPVSEIKAILIKLDQVETHTHGGKIAEQLVSQFEDILSDPDFSRIVDDPLIQHLY